MTWINFEKLAIVIITHDRPRNCQQTLETALATIPNYRALYLIGNHPNDTESVVGLKQRSDPRFRFIATGRTPEHQGRLAESWNLAFQWAFRESEIEWLWCMHDDLRIVPGWVPKLEQRPADLYLSPFGDMCFLLNRRTFSAVGWFDERYPGIGYQDSDWQLRAAWKLGKDRVVLENDFRGPGQDLKWLELNVIGLNQFWTPAEKFSPHPGALEGLEWFRKKWGAHWLRDHYIDWGRAIGDGPSIPEIDWYPWFEREQANG